MKDSESKPNKEDTCGNTGNTAEAKKEEIKAYFSRDAFASNAGCEIVEADDDYCLCRMNITELHRNARGAVMGGAVFTLADFTFAVAANMRGIPTVSLSASVTYIAEAQDNVLYAKTHMIHSGKSTCAAIVTVYDGKGVSVASVTFSGFRLTGK